MGCICRVLGRAIGQVKVDGLLERGMDGRVKGEEKYGDGQSVGVRFVSSEEEGEGVTYDCGGREFGLREKVCVKAVRECVSFPLVTYLADWLA